jgi:sec-independent protein translocase protein TatB
MFDVGGPEFLLLVVLALIVFGPRRLPQLARTLGSFVGQARGAVRDFRGTLEREVALDDVRQVSDEVEGIRRDLREEVTQTKKAPERETSE